MRAVELPEVLLAGRSAWEHVHVVLIPDTLLLVAETDPPVTGTILLKMARLVFLIALEEKQRKNRSVSITSYVTIVNGTLLKSTP